MRKIWKMTLAVILLLLVVIGVGAVLYHFKMQKKRHARALIYPVVEDKSFVVVIPSYNNSAYCERNLRSVLEQDYDNFRVIYIDDASTDDTLSKVKKVIADSHQTSRVTLIHNQQNQGALANLYGAVHSCKDHEIIVCVDGDDFLAHNGVLAKLNQIYANPDVWMTYGNYVDFPSYKQKPTICKKISTKVINNSSYRHHEWCSSHLRTFYVALFKKIKLQDLIYKDKFYPKAADLAVMFPLLEMAGRRCVFVRDVLYLYNRSNPLNDHTIDFPLQEECARHIRSLPKYARLKQLSLEGEVCQTTP